MYLNPKKKEKMKELIALHKIKNKAIEYYKQANPSLKMKRLSVARDQNPVNGRQYD